MASMKGLTLSLKVVLICTGAVSLAMAMRFTIPSLVNFVAHELPLICSTLFSFLKPSYLFVLINIIIFTVVASSRFHQYVDDETQHHEQLLVSPAKPPAVSDPTQNFAAAHPLQLEFTSIAEESQQVVVTETEYEVVDVKPVTVNGSEVAPAKDEDLPVLSKSIGTLRQRIRSSETEPDFHFPINEKPLVLSSEFESVGHGKPSKVIREGGKAVKLATDKRHDTLENTWKMITEGHHVSPTKHLRKSDTWENHGREVSVTALERAARHPAIKSETFKDRTNYERCLPSVSPSPASGKIMREPSLTPEEVNRRVEAFIKKFNEEMRLQRQQSLNQYAEMIKSGGCELNM